MSVRVQSENESKNEPKSKTNNFHIYCEELEWRSGDELRFKVEQLVQSEKMSIARLIAHLSEIGRRKLYLQWGYRNLFDYCQRSLGLSEGSIALRIQVANVCRKFSVVLSFIAEGKVNLTVAGRLAPHLTAENVSRVLDDCAGMTRAQVQEYVTAFAPKWATSASPSSFLNWL